MLQTKESIGQLDRRVYFQEKLTEIDESNANSEIGWQNITNAGWWCSWNDNPGNEVMQAEQLVGVQITALIGRTRNIDIKWRVSFAGIGYEIISVQRLNRRYIRILIKSGQQYIES